MCEIGDLIEGRYRVERSVGSGGMGIVYQATDEITNCPVAVKVMGASVDPSVAARARLQREITLLSQLHSPHVAKFVAAGYLEDGLPYFVMEFLDGRDLKAELRRRGPLPCGEAAAYLVQACRGIAVAHRLGIVHRDLKPHNLFLTGIDGVRTVKIVDFGVAKSLDAFDPGLTATDAAVGTPLYMSPEQLIDPRDISTKADVWALGVTLYELLAGFSPFADSSPGAVIAAVTLDDPVPIQKIRPDLPDGIAKAIELTLMKLPSDRIGTAEELEQLLRRHATPDDQLVVPTEIELQTLTEIVRPPRTRVSAYLRDRILAAIDADAPEERATLRCLPAASTHGSRPIPERLSLVPALRSLTPELPALIDQAKVGNRAPTVATPPPRRESAVAKRLLALAALLAAVSIGVFEYGQRFRNSRGAVSVQTANPQSRAQALIPPRQARALSPREDSKTERARTLADAEPAVLAANPITVVERESPPKKVRYTHRSTTIAAPEGREPSAPAQTAAPKIVPRHL